MRRTGLHYGVWIAGCLAAVSPAQSLAQCAPWGPGTNLSNDAGYYAVDGHTAVDATGVVHVVYQSFLDSVGRNYYTTHAEGGWSARVNVGSMGGKGSTPKIVITPDQQLHVFYGKNDLCHRTKPLVGGSWSAPTLLTQGSFIYDVVRDSAGGLYFVYGHLFDSAKTPRNGIWGRALPLGGVWGGEELVYGNGDDGNWPRAGGVAVRGDVIWCGIEVSKRLYFKKRPAGGPWPSGTGAQFLDRGAALQWAVSPAGNEVAGIYHESMGGGESDPWFEVFVRYSHDDGATWTPPENISLMTNDIDRSPQATYDDNGNLHVVWEGFCCDHKSRIRYRGRLGGYWGEILNLVPTMTTGIVTGALQAQGNTVYLTHAATGSGVVGLYDVFIRSMAPAEPIIQIQPTGISRTLWVHETITPDTFTIVNGCPGTLSYTLSADAAAWMQLSVTGGSSGTEQDTITLSYPGVSQLRAGRYEQRITISGNASNSPVVLPVTVDIRTVGPDLDGDEDVDQDDFAILQTCLSGAYIPQNDPACRRSRFDMDDDVDGDDIAVFLRCMQGSNRIPPRGCAG